MNDDLLPDDHRAAYAARTVDVLSVPGDPGRPNEDFAQASPRGVAVVLDGVTPPVDGDDGCRHGVAWFTEHLGRRLVRTSEARRDVSIAECLSIAIADTARAHGPGCDLSYRNTPQATVAMFRWDLEKVEYLVLSDAVVLLSGVDGRVTAVLDDRLDILRVRPDLMTLRRKIDAAPAESAARSAAKHAHAAAWKALRNAEGGFFTAAADPAVACRAVTGGVPRDQVRAAAALTDGATRWAEVFDYGDWADLLAVIRHSGVRALIDQVRRSEHEDSDRIAFPRAKTYDDASAAFVAW